MPTFSSFILSFTYFLPILIIGLVITVISLFVLIKMKSNQNEVYVFKEISLYDKLMRKPKTARQIMGF